MLSSIRRRLFNTTSALFGKRHTGALINDPGRYSKKKMKRVKREQERIEGLKNKHLPTPERKQINNPITLYSDRNVTGPELRKEHAIAYETMMYQPKEGEVKEKDPAFSLDIYQMENKIFNRSFDSEDPIKDCGNLLRALGAQGYREKIKPTLVLMEEQVVGPLSSSIYNSALTAYTYTSDVCRSPDMEGIVDVVKRMQLLNVMPTIETFENLAKAACKNNELDSAFEVLRDIKKFALQPSLRLWAILIEGCCIAEEYQRGWDTFDLMRTRFNEPDVRIFNAMIKICGKQGEPARADNLFNEMQGMGLELNQNTYHAILYALARSFKYEMRAYQIYERMEVEGIEVNAVTFGILLFACTQRGDVNRAKLYWDEMLRLEIEPSEICYSTLLNVYAKSNLLGDVPDVSNDMMWRVHPKLREPRMSWHEYMTLEQQDYELLDTAPKVAKIKDMTEEERDSQMAMYAGAMYEAVGPKDHGHDQPDFEAGDDKVSKEKKRREYRLPLSWDKLPNKKETKEVLQKRNIAEAIAVFQKLKQKMKPTVASLNALLNVHAHADRINTAMRCLGLYEIHGLRPDARSFNSLIWMFCRNHEFEKALILKESLPSDVRVTEQMMDTLVFASGIEKDVEIGGALLEEMRARKMRPPSEGRLRPLRLCLKYKGLSDPNMPEDPYQWKEKVFELRSKEFGKTIRKKIEVLKNAGWNKTKLSAYNGFGAGKAGKWI